MGFFDFLKKKEPVAIKFSEIGEWLDKQVEDKKLNQRVGKAKSIIKEKIENSYKFLEAMEQAGLRNENIPDRIKHIMEGHRRTYIIKLKRFLDEIDMPDDYSEIGHYSARFSESIDKLSGDTQKNFMVLKEFMANEVARIVKSVKGIEDELSNLQAEIEKEGLELIKDAKIRLKQYKDDIKKKARLEEEKASQEKNLDSISERKARLSKRIEELKKSREYDEFKVFIDKKQKYEEQLRKIETDLKEVFAELHRPLKKYKRNSLSENIIDKYLLDPAGALESDDSLQIRDVLNKMKAQLDTLELKEKQLEKTAEMIDKLDKDFFTKRKLEIGRLKGLNKEAATHINKSVAALNVSENETWLHSVEEKIVLAEKALEEVKKEVADVNLDYLKQKVKEKVKEISNVIIEDD
ncbi:MAG: hypothetical protein KKF46_02070 [Nanoarchaeota archaeon]|nr:hypothetical protein [Nanoarchaeota archaeon]MBU1321120.1 hypothetical protein [Nanoarchaeota archaeon]MBU1598412.1 hypothetical protein [Nanoarchaeota archaeon]MBU2440877.1 hypothetical protein [Nanoarchaeota archaeon]